MAIVERDLGLVIGAIGPEGPRGPQGEEGPQGLQGPKGDNGIDANIVSATGTVNPGYQEEPTVEISVGGEAGENTLEFTFEGIQGKPGSDASVPIATTEEAGKVKPDGSSIRIDEEGTISVNTVAVATVEVAGTVKPDNKFLKVEDDGTIKIDTDYLANDTNFINKLMDNQRVIDSLIDKLTDNQRFIDTLIDKLQN